MVWQQKKDRYVHLLPCVHSEVFCLSLSLTHLQHSQKTSSKQRWNPPQPTRDRRSGRFRSVAFGGGGLDGNHGVQLSKADLGAVEAVGLVNFLDFRVARLSKLDVDALFPVLAISHLEKCPGPGGGSLTEYKAAPCTACSTTWIVALSPTLTSAFLGRGTWGKQMVPG
jgi:hypothetical protein